MVAVRSPCCNDLSGLLQRFKPVLIQAFIAEGAVEAFDVGILGWAAGFDEDAVHPFVVDVGVLRAQDVVDHAVAPAPAGYRLQKVFKLTAIT